MIENQPALESENAFTVDSPVAPVAAPSALDLAANAHAVMVKEIRSWSYWLLGLGALHLVASGFLDAPWGILLLVVGLASFVFQEAAMFVIYGVTLAWAATSNATGGQAGWIFFALFQLYLAFQIFRRFFVFRKVQAGYAALRAQADPFARPAEERAARVFPGAGCLVGALALVGAVSIGGGIIAAGVLGATRPPDYLGLLISAVVNLGVLGLAISLAALLSDYRNKPLAVLGILSSVVVLLLWLALAFGLL
jgi:hypothetical protein